MTPENPWAQAAVEHVETQSSGGPLDRAYRSTLNFHPDRESGGVHILEGMAETGHYRSQFETGTSNGGLTDARIPGQAVRSERGEPWPVKHLWHHVAQWGRPRSLSRRGNGRADCPSG